MNFQKLEIPDVILIIPKVFGDDRGFFMETYRQSGFIENGISQNFVQDNYSKSTKNVLRGLHYQIDPKAQGKLVRVTFGEVFDVAVDIRKNSPTYGKWVGQYLSAQNKHIMYIPPGFAHGFLVISDYAEFSYKCTEYYSPEHERCIAWNDPDLNISWPTNEPLLSDKDKKGLCLSEATTPCIN